MYPIMHIVIVIIVQPIECCDDNHSDNQNEFIVNCHEINSILAVYIYFTFIKLLLYILHGDTGRNTWFKFSFTVQAHF